jgi:D-alanine--poly(phosphoribitol) ligase subunit 1
MKLIKEISESISKHSLRNAFFIDEVFYTYEDFAKSISGIRKLIQLTIPESEKNIGLVANNDLKTYASIVALWLEGKAFVPISPDAPADRNESMTNQIGINTIIGSSKVPLSSEYSMIDSSNLPETEVILTPVPVSEEELSFILFTSGSTGNPKGVPITIANITAFIECFSNLDYKIDENDKILQMFELTFDASVMLFLLPLLKGACIFTIPKDRRKYLYILELFEDYKLTTALLMPSTLCYFRPFFNELNFESVKLCMLGGEAVPLDLAEEWSKCVPNATVLNMYGPTEDTIVCSSYLFNRNGINKSHNGILSIGFPLSGCEIIIVDENKNILDKGEKGEICLGGDQLTPGYWNNEERNKEVFFNINYKGKSTRFYRTGDLGYIDKEGYMMFIGRIDFQAKIKGYRVELTEIEFYAKSALGKINVVAIPYKNMVGETDLGLVVESEDCNQTDLINYMKTKVPFYMIPAIVKLVKEFPLNKNGKVDRKGLEQLFML